MEGLYALNKRNYINLRIGKTDIDNNNDNDTDNVSLIYPSQYEGYQFSVSDRLNQSGGYSQTGAAPQNKRKWVTLKHNGVMFYPEYEPHEIPIKYGDNEILRLNPEAEEFVTYYVQPRFDKYKNDRFNKNFFKSWKKTLDTNLKSIIKDFSLCDFSDIKGYVLKDIEEKKDRRGQLSREEKELEKEKNDKEKRKYDHAIVDDKEQTLDNYLVEPPTIFVGRGSHPLSGTIKTRLYPEHITLNIGKNMPIPIPDVGEGSHKWGEVISDNTLEWIASWQNNVTQKYNYTRFGRKSTFKMKSDETKYDLARKLKKKIKKIREKNEKNMQSSNLEIRQLATALYLIDKLALRIGNEKREDEADTVGITTLKIKNVSLLDGSKIKLDFLGKDSVRYVNKFKVPQMIYTNIKEFHDDIDKNKEDEVFHVINADTLNKYIKGFMKKLTSKVFRTYNASYLMQIELKRITNKYNDYDKTDKLQKIKHEYDMANLKVAKLCNHQKMATKGGAVQLEKTQTKIKEINSKINKLLREKKKKQDTNKPVIALNKRITKWRAQLKTHKNKKSLQTESKTLSVGTSKINYIDPRITIAFLKKNNIMDGIDKFFTKTHQRNFEWAMEINDSWRF